MPKGSEELTNARKNEIISACAALYETDVYKRQDLLCCKTSFGHAGGWAFTFGACCTRGGEYAALRKKVCIFLKNKVI